MATQCSERTSAHVLKVDGFTVKPLRRSKLQLMSGQHAFFRALLNKSLSNEGFLSGITRNMLWGNSVAEDPQVCVI